MVRDDLDALLMVRELLLTAKPTRNIRNTFSNVVPSQLSKFLITALVPFR